MIPFRDENPSGRIPVVTILLIALNALAFLYEIALGPRVELLLARYALVPSHFFYFLSSPSGHFGNTFLPVFTSMFLHGGWLHLIKNMWYLWIFGDNVEDRLGHFRFLVFYLVCGVAAAGTHLALNQDSDLPMIGASGAISGVLGAYLICFPGARILTLIPMFFIWPVVEMPAAVLLGLWFMLQLLSGLGAPGEALGGVAWWAHVGGFIAGVVLVMLLPPSRLYRQRRRARPFADEWENEDESG